MTAGKQNSMSRKSVFIGKDIVVDKKEGFSLSLSYQGLNEIPEDVIKKNSRKTTSLDLSYNIFKYPFHKL